MLLFYEALFKHLYKDWLHLDRVSRTLMPNYFSYLSIDPFQRGCCHSSAQSCLILCNPMDCSPWGSSVHGILPIYEVLTIYTSSQFTHMGTKRKKSTVQQIWWLLLLICSNCMLCTVGFKMTKIVPMIELNKHWLSILNPNIFIFSVALNIHVIQWYWLHFESLLRTFYYWREIFLQRYRCL